MERINELNALLDRANEYASRVPYHCLVSCIPKGSRIELQVLNKNASVLSIAPPIETRCGYLIDVIDNLPDYLKAVKYTGGLAFIDSIVKIKVKSLPND